MKVIHLSYTDSDGGAGRSALRILYATRTVGVMSVMLVGAKYSDSVLVTQVTGKLGRVGLRIKGKISSYFGDIIRTNNNTRISNVGLFRSNLKKILDDCDIVHLHWVAAEFLSFSDLKNINKPIVWTLHDLWPVQGVFHVPTPKSSLGLLAKFVDSFVSNRKAEILSRKIDKGLIRFVAPSQAVAKYVIKAGLPSSCVSVISNPIDSSVWYRSDRNDDNYKRFGLSSRKLNFLMGGFNCTLDENKNFKIVMDNYLNIKNSLPNVNLIFLTNDSSSVPENVRQDSTILRPINDDTQLKDLYSVCDAVLMPSKFETFGQMAAEAAFCGTPTVAFDGTGLSDIVKHGCTGYLAKPEDFTDYLNGMCFVVGANKKSMMEGIMWDADLVSNWARKRFDLPVIGSEYAKIYESVRNVFK